MSDFCCPTCGGPLRDQVAWHPDTRTFIADGRSVRFTKVEAMFVNAIWNAKGGMQSREQLMQAVYGGRIDGGPESTSVVSVHLAHVRKGLGAIGWTVTPNMEQPRTGYRLVKLEARA